MLRFIIVLVALLSFSYPVLILNAFSLWAPPISYSYVALPFQQHAFVGALSLSFPPLPFCFVISPFLVFSLAPLLWSSVSFCILLSCFFFVISFCWSVTLCLVFWSCSTYSFLSQIWTFHMPLTIFFSCIYNSIFLLIYIYLVTVMSSFIANYLIYPFLLLLPNLPTHSSLFTLNFQPLLSTIVAAYIHIYVYTHMLLNTQTYSVNIMLFAYIFSGLTSECWITICCTLPWQGLLICV